MPFPEAERVIFKKNPLRSVICQLRFPTILTVETQIPDKFQEGVRHKFPEFGQVSDTADLQIPDSLADFIPDELREAFTIPSNRRYLFATSDSNWVISLTKDFIALEAKQYIRWEEFRQHLQLAVGALLDVYRPAHFTRIGLRYQNVIDRDLLGLQAVPWSELLTEIIIGPHGQELEPADVVENHGNFSIRLGEGGDMIRVQYGLGSDNPDTYPKEKYLLDNDLFTEVKTPPEVNRVIEIADRFNGCNRNFFHWCIRDRLRDAMGRGGA